MNMPQAKSFTGRVRRKRTRWSVKFGDAAARLLITVGGIGTIVAVCLVFVFLGAVAVPLFYPAAVRAPATAAVDWRGQEPLRVLIDEYQTIALALYADGTLESRRLDSGAVIERRALTSGNPITAWSFRAGYPDVVLGFGDGTVRVGRIGFATRFLEHRDLPAELRELPEDQSALLAGGLVRRTPQGQFRVQTVVVEFGEPIRLSDAAVRKLAHSVPAAEGTMPQQQTNLVAYFADDSLQYCRLTEKKNRLTKKTTLEQRLFPLPMPEPESALGGSVQPLSNAAGRSSPAPVHTVLLSSRGDSVLLVREDGQLLRWETVDPAAAEIVEAVDLLPPAGATVTACEFLLGGETLIVGDSAGGVRGWFRVLHDADEIDSKDRFALTMVHELPPAESAVCSLRASERSRMLAVGFADGRLRVYFVTSERLLIEQTVTEGRPLRTVAIAPKDDGLVAAADGRLWRCQFAPAHPEASLKTLFRPVWYEGYQKPESIWQSSFAGVGPEMKLGLMPLIFGTIKATTYSMLFGAPLALLAAIYTSEFLKPRMRARIKPAIEMMASLPSVVLGFLAGLVFAPVIETIVPTVLMMFLTVPLTLLLMSQLWLLLPNRTAQILTPYRFGLICLVLPFGFWLAFWLGPVAERWLFAGDLRRWLNQHGPGGETFGTGLGAWLIVLLPAASLAVLGLVTTQVNTWLRSVAAGWSRGRFAAVNLLKFALGVLAAFALAYGGAWLLTAAGLDPRGSFLDTYEQRNALVVGLVMGFAIIPIIYTIADDALATVPMHLRSGSLGCGATPWQTTWRVVIPTAMSGLFSALMIGLGRAVGETMIVLMAGGNTPVTDWNIFSGFRTLAANIAVELPEAIRDSTHYRTLFLAALTLFLLTFCINTLAEIVRLRFRRRAYQL